ncbi:MAG: hypothetical protein HYY04_13135 [Chloroflexi bacterium]|nr:hypothetical protein [Chloroflexota bacterium]
MPLSKIERPEPGAQPGILESARGQAGGAWASIGVSEERQAIRAQRRIRRRQREPGPAGIGDRPLDGVPVHPSIARAQAQTLATLLPGHDDVRALRDDRLVRAGGTRAPLETDPRHALGGGDRRGPRGVHHLDGRGQRRVARDEVGDPGAQRRLGHGNGRGARRGRSGEEPRHTRQPGPADDAKHTTTTDAELLHWS